MKNKIRARGKIEDGKLSLIDKVQFKKELSQLDGQVVIEIQERGGKRTLQQNKYYWGVVIPAISQKTGYGKEMTHSVLKNKFLKYTTDEGFEVTPSTTELDKTEFRGYVNDIKEWAYEFFDIQIPGVN